MEKGFIRKEDDEEDKRKKNVYLLVEPETLVTPIDERIQRIGTSAKTLCE
jgi:DNA-binding MarR family transcriptional regulator